MDKDYGINHYENKIRKKNNNGKPNRTKEKIGNSYSGGAYRPSSILNSNKINNIQERMAAEQHHVVDFTANPKKFRKSFTPQDIRNKQERVLNNNKTKNKNIKKPISKLIHLNKISDNLFLGNWESIDILEETIQNIDSKYSNNPMVILNLTDNKLKKINDKDIVYDIAFKKNKRYENNGWYTSVYNDYQKCTTSCIEIIKECKRLERNVILICETGINKSVSVAISYAMLECGMEFNTASDIIDCEKLDNYENWNSLTDNTYRNFTRAFIS